MTSISLSFTNLYSYISMLITFLALRSSFWNLFQKRLRCNADEVSNYVGCSTSTPSGVCNMNRLAFQCRCFFSTFHFPLELLAISLDGLW